MGYDTAARAAGEPAPYIFILDNGQSYRRFMEAREDGRYCRFDFEKPPGINPFQFQPTGGDNADTELDEHVSRLEALLADFTSRNSSEDEQAMERKKGVRERALYTMYREQRPQTFQSLRDIFTEFASHKPENDPEGMAARELAADLFSFAEGKASKLFLPNPDATLSDDVHAVCYDFQGLADHPDLAAISLLLCIYQIRRFATRVSRLGHRTLMLMDEAWALLDPSTGGARVAAAGSRFITATVRMGRKEGWSIIGLSQRIGDFVTTAHGAALVELSATKFIGKPGRAGLAGLQEHAKLTPRQLEQVQTLRHTKRYHEFLLIQGDTTHVVRVPLDSFSRWLFTTDPPDRDRLRALEESRPELSLLERIRLLANTSEEESRARRRVA
jgi:type IV secretory pathway VirB4 component